LSKASVAAVAVTLVAVATRFCAPWQAVQQHAVSDLFGLPSLLCGHHVSLKAAIRFHVRLSWLNVAVVQSACSPAV
jgi:hypothetical protein